ncbi:MAG: ASCH domain-containing protein [Rhizobiaceae bacterium]
MPKKYSNAPSFSFGDSPKMADDGARDVIARKQVATCVALAFVENGTAAKPEVGLVEIILNGKTSPSCAIETWKTDTQQYDQIDLQFALDEGCRDLKEWQDIHEAYFKRRNCFSPTMKIYRQYFNVIEVFEDVETVGISS